MSNVVYKGKGQVPLYRIYRHSITPWGPQEGWGDTFPLEQQLYSQEWFSPEGWAARWPSGSPDLSLLIQLGPVFCPPLPLAPYKEPP